MPDSKPGDLVQIYCWNVNGIRAILEKPNMTEFLKKENPPILCFNEPKIDELRLTREKIKQEFDIYPFQYWNCSKPPKTGYSGCTVLSKFKPISVSYDLGIEKHDQEGRSITIEYDKFVLVAVYVPNSGHVLKRIDYRTKEWDIDFREYLQKVGNEKQKPVVVCGDLNCAHQEIDISKPKANLKSPGFTVEERAGFEKLLATGFVDTFRKLYPGQVKYSYWNTKTNAREINSGWRLDYFLVPENIFPAVIDSEILDQYYGSDHCPIKLSLDLRKIESEIKVPVVESHNPILPLVNN